MRYPKTAALTALFFELDSAACYRFNRISRVPALRTVFAVVSRLGNGVFWYTLIALMPLFDRERGYHAAAHMLLVGLAGLVIYKLIKTMTVRSRPFVKRPDINLGVAPLDQYSFPSGHTLHAFSFTLIATAYYPFLYISLVIFTVLVALSRVVLGLHYPTDVLAGAAIGISLAELSLLLL